MEPGVPFALLGAVALLAVASWVGLAAVALARASGRVSAPAVVATGGATVLAIVETVTAIRFGQSVSDLLPSARALGLLLVAGGLFSGAMLRRRSDPLRPLLTAPRSAGAAPSVVVPLASGVPAAVVVALAGAAAAAAALRHQRDATGLLLAVGLLVGGAAAAFGPAVDDPSTALAVLLLRGGGALLVLVALLALAQASLLGKVIAAILAGVLVTATSAVAVVGTVVAGGYEREQGTLVRAAAQSRLEVIDQTLDVARGVAQIAAAACRQDPASCSAAVTQLSSGQDAFALAIPAEGPARSLGGNAPLDAAEVVALAGSPPVVTAVDREQAGDGGLQATGVRLLGREPGLALIVVLPQEPAPTAGSEVDGPDVAAPPGTFVYGVRLGDAYVGRDSETGAFRFTLLVGGQVVASNLSGPERGKLEQITTREDIAGGLEIEGRTVPADGDSPTVHFQPVLAADGTQVGTLALSREARAALAAQQDALAALLLAALLVLTVVAVGALVLGQRTVGPVRRLTEAATRVAAGDLSVSTDTAGRDEVGTLARTFDAMTTSVAQLTSDLRATAGRLATVQASITDGLLATDASGRVSSINRAALAILGVEYGQAIGRSLGEVVHLRSGGQDLVLRARSPRVIDPGAAAEVVRSDGTVLPVRAELTTLEDGSGVLLVLRDTTREREVDRLKTEFLSNVSHELRTPLTPIRGYAEMLVARPGLPRDRVGAFAAEIRDESLKMNRVVDLLVDVAALEAGRVRVQPQPCTAAEVVDARLGVWRERAPARADDLRRRVTGGLPRVLVDPAWLGKALDELIDNALKYTAAGTTVTLTASPSPDQGFVRLAVRDAGAGFEPADRAAVFGSFEQVDASATRRVGGLGLGLSFVRRLAQDAGWPLSVSTVRGRGAEFALDVPVAGQ